MPTPRIITAAEIGLHFVDVGFGQLGPERYVTGHYTAGPKDGRLRDTIGFARRYHDAHKANGWGGIGYHYMLPRHALAIVCLRPVVMKGTHTALHNSNNVGVVCNGTTGDKPTKTQQWLFRWLLAHAHTEKMPRAHRTDRVLGAATMRGHNDWADNATACPGAFKPMYLSKGKKR